MKLVNIQEQVIDIICRAIGVDSSELTEKVSIGDLPEWDSVGNLAILAALEEELQIEIPLEDLFEMNSVASIIEEVKKLTDA